MSTCSVLWTRKTKLNNNNNKKKDLFPSEAHRQTQIVTPQRAIIFERNRGRSHITKNVNLKKNWLK